MFIIIGQMCNSIVELVCYHRYFKLYQISIENKQKTLPQQKKMDEITAQNHIGTASLH